jgi:thiol-disulfide isomerase/thioredoxin
VLGNPFLPDTGGKDKKIRPRTQSLSTGEQMNIHSLQQIGIVLFVLAVGVVLYAVAGRESVSEPMAETEVLMGGNDSGVIAADGATAPVTNDRYQVFSPGVLEKTAQTRRVLFFYANWCPTCRPVDKNLTDQMAQLPEDVTVIRVNYNDTQTDQAEKDLAKKYGITYQHTFVQIDEQGSEVAKWNGGQLEELLEKLK